MEVYILIDHPPSEDIVIDAHKNGTLRKLEDKINARVVVSDDKYIYVTSIDIYNNRMKITDKMLGLTKYHATIFLCETALHECKTRDGIVYTLGNIYGASSIILGTKFKDIVNSDIFNSLIGRKLKNVRLSLLGNGILQYKLDSYEFRD